MKDKKSLVTGIVALLGMCLLILDTQTAFSGAKAGVDLCQYVLIPSLFPFFILSTLASSALTGTHLPLLSPLCKQCGIPEGGESLFLLGLTGGYPVGAKAITEAYESGQLSVDDAHRLLGFCSNAGPAFIFGMAGRYFDSPAAPWLLWAVHILSAILTGMLLPNKKQGKCSMRQCTSVSVPAALNQSLRAMAGVCGWVVIFRVVLQYCSKHLLVLLPPELQVILTGLLELSNGIAALCAIPHQGMRFIICTCLISFGGLCVGMQTISVTKRLGIGMYFPGKLLQCIISCFLSQCLQSFLFPQESQLGFGAFIGVWVVSFAGITSVFWFKRIGKAKKVVAFLK